MTSGEDFRAEKARKIIDENREGLESLAKEEPAQKERDHPVKAKARRIYRKYIKKPKAKPVVI